MKKASNIKPILFSTPMVRAILSGNKTITRREITERSAETIALMINVLAGANVEYNKSELLRMSKFQIDDILWVRETWQKVEAADDVTTELYGQYDFIYRATKGQSNYMGILWKPSIFMPKGAARIFLKITDVRIECLQDIRNDDAIAEGIEVNWCSDHATGHTLLFTKDYLTGIFSFINPVQSFKSLWQSINGTGDWERNPLVWAISFEVTEKPEDFI